MTKPSPPMPRADELPELPVRTRAELLARIESIVQQACRRQIWFLFFDRDEVQLPVLVPMDIPQRPEPLPASDLEAQAAAIAAFLDAASETADGASLAVVYERPGPAALRPEDSAWFEFLARVVERAGTPVRAVVAVTGRRFRIIADHMRISASSEIAS